MRTFLFILIISGSVTSCYNYRVFPKEYRNYNYQGEKKIAFVVNQELKKEYEILKQSEIFQLTNDSVSNKAVKVKLQPLTRNLVCGSAIVLSAFSLGQLPVYFPDTYHFRFEEIRIQDTTSKDFALHIAQRIWFWDMFALHKNFKAKAGKALKANYYKK